jgi:hypothetical protein
MFFPGFDPSKLDPATLLKLQVLMQKLGPERLARIQTIMHNLNAGHAVQSELEAFERDLPPGFRDELLEIMKTAGPAAPAGATKADVLPGSVREARLTILRAVAEGSMSPEEADAVLFPA